jgi:hypothetical protein
LQKSHFTPITAITLASPYPRFCHYSYFPPSSINYHYILTSFHQYLNQKRTRRGRAIDHLVKTNDQRIQNISCQDLLLLKNEIPYHSPEESMTDTSDEEGNKGPAHLVAVMNLQWRSSKVSKL